MPQKKLLIVDDDRTTRDALQTLFISRGWEVAMVVTRAEGLSLLRDYDPDWVVITWDQLDGTGERFMAEVRAKPCPPKVALLTEPYDRLASSLACRLKAELRFCKPIVPEEVFRACDARREGLRVCSGGHTPQTVAHAV
jgi:DNA-binding response OmpR family regulator